MAIKIPNGCLTIKQAAEEINTTSHRLHQLMRVHGWLIIDRKGNYKGTSHNAPKQFALARGYLLALEDSYLLKGENPIEKRVVKPVLTPRGFFALKNIIQHGELPKSEPPVRSAPPAPVNPEPTTPARKNIARKSMQRIHSLFG